ncbi:uncharacterized protein [Phaseolus vulgaris]|uniref:uncharacterized protein n=1 Tax=Phaseolus vulgaris TaxID=3885 RepID=UPI0035C969CE
MPRNTPEYMEGLNKFLDFAFANNGVRGKIICPCQKCNFNKWECREVVYEHLIVKPFSSGYKVWLLYGERTRVNATDEAYVMPQEDNERIVVNNLMCDMVNDAFGHHQYSNDMVNDREPSAQPSHTVNDDIEDFFELMQDGQESLYEGCDKYSKLSFLIKLYHIKCLCKISDKAMSMILELLVDAFEHAKIPHSFYEAKKTIKKLGLHYTKIDACPNDCMLYFGEDANKDFCNKRKKIPAKVLRYFPLKSRLQRMFMSSKIAEHMRWHASESTDEGILRHPRDSEAWKSFDFKHPQFSSDPRNVRLGLATDGFNPYGNLSTSHSIWPVVLIPYNLPPWMCMKQSSFILSMIIPGKRAPGNDIDVYLQPLIEELKELWNTGVKTFDSYGNEVFDMHAAILWTISDFPGLGTLSGWNTHTGLACPRCNFDTIPKKLLKGGKFCFMSHRRWLDGRHRFRLARMRFDGTIEDRSPPLKISGYDILQQVQNLNVEFGKEPILEERAKRQRGVNHANSNKCKDNLKARKDLQLSGIRPDLWPDENGRYLPAIYTLTNVNKDIFLKTLKNITIPNGYSSNISRCIDVKQFMAHLIVHLVEDVKLGGLVQYRWMYPIERYLGKLKSYVRNKAQAEGSITEGYMAEEALTFCLRYLDGIETVFNRLHRVNDEPAVVPSNENTLFPPVGKPVGGFTYFTLSTNEKLQAHRHVLTNCTIVDPFLQEFRDTLRRQLRSRTRSSSMIDKRVHREFAEWFSRRIRNESIGIHSDDLKFLAMGPIDCAKQYSAYNVNGFKFRILERDLWLKTQNSGVFGTFGTRSYASSNDNQMRFGGVPYYGQLIDIIEINYHGRFSIVLFKCMWTNTTTSRGIMSDEYGFTLLNFSRLIHTGDNDDDEPYIQASEAQMVYYVENEFDKNWCIPVHLKPRDLYNMVEDDVDNFHESEPFEQQNIETLFLDVEENIQLTRPPEDEENTNQ